MGHIEESPCIEYSLNSLWAILSCFVNVTPSFVLLHIVHTIGTPAGKFSVLGSLNSYIPTDGWYEFYYRENNNWVRWKQSYNPLSRVTSGTSGTASEYTYIGGSANPYSSFSGLTRYTSDDSGSCYLRGAPSWWCAIAPYQTSYDVFPDMWGNSTANHHQELWIRIDNLKAAPEFNDNDVKLNSAGVMAGQLIEN